MNSTRNVASRGLEDGHELEDWLRAEEELTENAEKISRRSRSAPSPPNTRQDIE